MTSRVLAGVLRLANVRLVVSIQTRHWVNGWDGCCRTPSLALPGNAVKHFSAMLLVNFVPSQLRHVSEDTPVRLSLRSRTLSRKLSDHMQNVKRRIGKNILRQENECVVRQGATENSPGPGALRSHRRRPGLGATRHAAGCFGLRTIPVGWRNWDSTRSGAKTVRLSISLPRFAIQTEFTQRRTDRSIDAQADASCGDRGACATVAGCRSTRLWRTRPRHRLATDRVPSDAPVVPAADTRAS